jgi:heme-degrading monooxygenase HmoA
MRDIRAAAIHMPGFVSGETLRNSADPHHYVIISSWLSRDDWDAWASRKERLTLRESIAPMLTEPEKLTILEHL